MNRAEDVFLEIETILASECNMLSRYHRLNRLLERCIKICTADYQADFTHLSTRLHTLCRVSGINPYPIELFRVNARKVYNHEYQPREKDFLYDVKALCEAISAFYKTEIPQRLQRILPHQWRAFIHPTFTGTLIRRIRLTVCRWEKCYLYGFSEDIPSELPLKVLYANSEESPFYTLHSQLYEGAQVNLLSVRTESDILVPEMVVLDPDYLIDITAVCGCIRPYGNTPLTHLLHKFLPAAQSEAICLGNMANQFLDDCVNCATKSSEIDAEELYLRSLQKCFQAAALEISTLSGINSEFFERTRTQFKNIFTTVQEKFSAADIDIQKANVQLEPSFLCEALGLQGRMDLVLNDFSKIVELKSGKADEYPQLKPKEEHALQMALYKEVLYYNLDIPRERIQTYLFYSHYPRFYHINIRRKSIHEAIALRNGIVHIDRILRSPDSQTFLNNLKEEHFNICQNQSKLYTQWIKPSIYALLHNLQHTDEVVSAYFHTFLNFIGREQLLSKTGDGRPDSGRGFADTWNANLQDRLQDGNILTDLKLHPIEALDGSISHLYVDILVYDENILPNFRQGDWVMLYKREHENDNATTQQIFRCSIEKITSDSLLLKLSYPQRNVQIFQTQHHYALELAYSDGTYTQAYRGLYALLTAPQERRQLTLGQRVPRYDAKICLNKIHPNPEIKDIVLRAKQAEDYFLLIGPPGTGKTSVALRAMVEEFLLDTPRKNLLIMAYTNQAVDEICGMLESIVPCPEYVRIGQELSCDERFRPRLLKYVLDKAENRKQLYTTLQPLQIFVGTIASISGCPELFQLKRFDTALVDEASQVLEPQLLPLLCATTSIPSDDFTLSTCAIRKFILIGDHKQLPAVVLQAPALSAVHDERLHRIGLYNCRNSLFERLHTLQSTFQTEQFVGMLHRQGRMHQSLGNYASHAYYSGLLDVVPLPHQTADCPDFSGLGNDNQWLHFVAETRMGLIPCKASPYSENNKTNAAEADIIARLVKAIHTLCLRKNVSFNAASRIGIIVPFRGQIAMIRKKLSEQEIPESDKITIDTVERYQGSQRDIILFSTTISQPYQVNILSAPTVVEGTEIDRKLNVAITRARKQFFLTGDTELLRYSPSYRMLMDYMTEADVR